MNEALQMTPSCADCVWLQFRISDDNPYWCSHPDGKFANPDDERGQEGRCGFDGALFQKTTRERQDQKRSQGAKKRPRGRHA